MKDVITLFPPDVLMHSYVDAMFANVFGMGEITRFMAEKTVTGALSGHG